MSLLFTFNLLIVKLLFVVLPIQTTNELSKLVDAPHGESVIQYHNAETKSQSPTKAGQ